MVVLPRPALQQLLGRPLLSRIFVTDCGYFPHALAHGIRRAEGLAESVVIACVGGRGWCEIDGVRHTIRAGHVAILPANTPHAYGSDMDDPWTVWWVHVGGTDLADFADFAPQNPVREAPDIFRVASIIEATLEGLAGGLSETTFLAACSNAWQLIATFSAFRASSASSIDIVERARDHLRNNLDSTITVTELAAMSSLSPSHFAALFRIHFGMPVGRFHAEARMARARELLDTTDRSIANIATTVGYTDPFYFSRHFKKIHGITASAYRREAKG